MNILQEEELKDIMKFATMISFSRSLQETEWVIKCLSVMVGYGVYYTINKNVRIKSGVFKTWLRYSGAGVISDLLIGKVIKWDSKIYKFLGNNVFDILINKYIPKTNSTMNEIVKDVTRVTFVEIFYGLLKGEMSYEFMYEIMGYIIYDILAGM